MIGRRIDAETMTVETDALYARDWFTVVAYARAAGATRDQEWAETIGHRIMAEFKARMPTTALMIEVMDRVDAMVAEGPRV